MILIIFKHCVAGVRDEIRLWGRAARERFVFLLVAFGAYGLSALGTSISSHPLAPMKEEIENFCSHTIIEKKSVTYLSRVCGRRRAWELDKSGVSCSNEIESWRAAEPELRVAVLVRIEQLDSNWEAEKKQQKTGFAFSMPEILHTHKRRAEKWSLQIDRVPLCAFACWHFFPSLWAAAPAPMTFENARRGGTSFFVPEPDHIPKKLRTKLTR